MSEDERRRLEAWQRELEAREMRVQLREAAMRKRQLDRYGAPSGSEERLFDLERRVWELGRFRETVTESAWYPLIQGVRRFADGLLPWGTRRRSFFLAPVRAVRMLAHDPGGFVRRIPKARLWAPGLIRPADPPPHTEERYRVWHRRRYARARLRAAAAEAADLRDGPLISVVMPTYNAEPAWLRTAIGSVRAQLYPRWELCIADDASTRTEAHAVLRRAAADDPRIKVRFLEENRGISGASNAALELATGEFVALLDHDDELKPDSLLEVAKLIRGEPDLDYVYTDEDKRSPDDRLIDAFFKPDWSPDLLMSMNYLSHLSVFRRAVLERVGGFRSEMDGSQDYDLVLRVTEATDRIGHVPLPLYTWRMVPGSAAHSDEAKPWAYTAARRALEDALRRRGIAGDVEHGPFLGAYRVRYAIDGDPRVAVLVRDPGDEDLTRRTVEGIERESTYENRLVEVVPPGPFAERVNDAVGGVDADLLVVVEAGMEVLASGWIEALVRHGQRKGVGVVGGRILGPLGIPLHEGAAVVGGEVLEAAGVMQFTLGFVTRNCSAVGGGLLMIRPGLIRELGGFDPAFDVELGPIDLSLRAREEGHLVVYTPDATLGWLHGPRAEPSRAERERFRRRWAGYRDPYYSPNLDPDEAYAVRLRTHG
ncbi:MAG TPA: glycosyltransferase [Actinomycetota bacterium]|nr:glycosyltransferase [Actinomycetota bacterium]